MATEEQLDREIVAGVEAFGAKLAELIGGAEVSVAVYSLGLTRAIYAREDVIDALRKFALSSERVQIRVMVADARAATAGGNQFLDLARKLPSRVLLKELTPEKRESSGPEVIIVDGRRMLELPEQKRLEAYYYPRHGQHMFERQKEFNAFWDESEQVLELTTMRF